MKPWFRKTPLLICALLWQLAQSLHAQFPPIRFDHLSLEQGVSHNLVFCIQQDRDGFLWFGTMYGLVKYDGRNYTVYRHDPANEHSISYNDVIAIHEDRRGELWIGTWGGGLNIFDRNSGKFTRFLHDPDDSTSLSHNVVWEIEEDEDGTIWIGTENGLDKLVEKREGANSSTTACFIHYRFQSLTSTLRDQAAVRDIHHDQAGRLWIGTLGAGLNLFDNERERFMAYTHDSMNPSSLSSNLISSIYEDKEENLWIGTAGGGLNVLHAKQRKTTTTPDHARFIHYRHEPKNPYSLSDDAIGPILRDRNGSLWVGTLSGGLNKFDPASGRFTRYVHDPANPYSLSSNYIVTLCEDRSGILWIGSYNGGVDKFDPRQYKFVHFKNVADHSDNVHAILQDRDGVIWIGAFGGGMNKMIVKPAEQTPSFVRHRVDRDNVTKLVNAIIEDKQGTFWVGTVKRGLYALDRNRQPLAHYQNDSKNPHSLSNNRVNVIYEDRGGALWVGTAGGLNQLDRERKIFQRYQLEISNPKSLSDNFIHAIYEDSHNDGALWIGTYRGLNKFDRQSQTFKHYQHRSDDRNSLSNDYVYAICEDKAGALWAGTSDGLNKFDRAKENFKSYKEQDGLPNGVICGILEDDNGMLWISTKKGIARFDPRTETFRRFDVADGLQSNMFNIGAFFKNRDGEMFFGGINGFNRFKPAEIKDNPFTPPIALTAMKIFDKPASFAPNETVEFDYQDNFITFEFAALSYSQPEKNQYAYKLEGVDRDWIYCGAQNRASYTDLQPGNYIFRAKGANHDGVWNETGVTLQFVITPPFWRTWWFYSLMCGVAIFSGIFLYRLRLRHERNRIAEIERVKSEERLERFKAVEHARIEERERVRRQIAADFHDESGHKLTKISLFCGVVQSKLRHGAFDITEYVDRIMKVAASLHKDMSDFIWALDPDESTLYDTAIKLKDFGDKLFDRTGIRFSLQGLAPELEEAYLPMEARQNLTCIFKEGMNNVLKHAADSCKTVSCSFARENGRYSVTLVDDGKGFDPVRCAPGKGLRNMQKRAEAIHGHLQIISRLGKGTAICFVGEVHGEDDMLTTKATPVGHKEHKENHQRIKAANG